MMDWSDRHCRYFHRLLSRKARLYTEMVTTGAILHGDRDYLLGFDSMEAPLALQLGGSDSRELARCARIAADWGYDEVNLNCGCPSNRVQSGSFGACLMLNPARVADCVAAMQAATALPVTVKCRIGVDAMDSEDEFNQFIDTVAAAGCAVFIVHARKAWLSGLSPKQNRDIPPLHYDWVHRLKQRQSQLKIVLNGGVTDLTAAKAQLQHVDGVMLGRAAYQNPAQLAQVDSELFGSQQATNLHAVVTALLAYIDTQDQRGVPVRSVTRHVLGLIQARPGARRWRRNMSENDPVAALRSLLEAPRLLAA